MDMKHGKTTARRLLSMLLALMMCLGMLPVTAMAVDTKDTDEGEIRAGNVDTEAEPRFPIGIRRRAAAARVLTSGNVDVTDNRVTGVRVAYPSVKRDTAEITYTVPGRGTGVHVIALLDISIDNRACLGMLSDVMYDCEKIRYEKAENGYTAHDTGTTAKTLTYQHTAWDITKDNDANDSMVYELNPDFKQPGLGQADEIAGLEMALSALNNVPVGQTPVLFWVLSPDAAIVAGQKDTNLIKSKLDEVRAKLTTMGGRLVTWQMDSKASSWLAGDDTQVNYATTDTFRSKVQESLENIVADGARDFEITLNVPDSVSLVTGFKTDGMAIRRVRGGARYDSFEKFDMIINGRSATVKVPKLYNSREDIEVTFTVNLDTALNIKDTVPGSALSSGGTYGLGIFDEVPVDYPVFDKDAELDRTLRTVTFKAFDNASPDKTKEFKGLPGEFILTPDASEWNTTGQEFSGWVNMDRKDAYVRPGEEMKVPEEDVVMTALWGHVDLDLLLGDVVQGPEPGNMMYPGTDTSVSWYGYFNNLKNKFKNDLSVDWIKDIVSVTAVDEKTVSSGKPLDVVTVHGGINGGKPNGVYIGLDEKNPVAAYVLASKTDAGKYDLYLAGIGGVTAPYSLSYLFGSDYYFGPSALKAADLALLNTSKVTDMSDIFGGCSNLTTLDVSGFDTSKVTNMGGMFNECSKLTGLNVSGFDTSKVTNMGGMFNGCSKLTSLNTSWFNTSKVTNMWRMFFDCSNLTNLDVSGFDTSDVTSMHEMFHNCYRLSSLDVSCFDTSNVIDMWGMFNGCSGLVSLDVSNWDVSNVTSMGDMFSHCYNLKNLDVSNWDVSKVSRMPGLFHYCYGLTNLDVSNWNTSSATEIASIFSQCSNLTSLDVSNWNTSKVTRMSDAFYGCSSLTNLDVSRWDTSNVKYISGLFWGCRQLVSLDVSNFNTLKVMDMRCMFYDCQKLQTVKFGDGFYLAAKIYDENAVYYDDYRHGMFENCYALQSVDGLKWKDGIYGNVGLLTKMFRNCRALKSIDLSTPKYTEFTKLSDVSYMFDGCTSLTSVDLGGWAVPNLSHLNNMFSNTGSDSLTIDLSWTNLSNSELSLDGILSGHTGPVTLKIGDYVNDGSTTYNQKTNIINAFKAWKNQGHSLTIYKTGGSLVASAAIAPMLLASGDGPRRLAAMLLGSGVATVNSDVDYTQKVPTYKYPTPVDSTVSYIVRVNYAGDNHGKSGLIDVRYPLPEGVGPDLSIAEADRVAVGAITYEGGTTESSKSNLVPGKEFKLEGDDVSGYVLTGSVRDIPAGAYMDVVVKCVIVREVDSTKEIINDKPYWYWTGTSYATSNSGSADSNPLRLWYSPKKGNPDVPVQPDKALVSYLYTGDVPSGIEPPAQETKASGETVVPPVPAVPEGYVFEGWYKDDVDAVTRYVITSEDVTTGVKFYGRWKLKAGVGNVNLTYWYDGDVPPEFMDFHLSTDLKLGAQCNIMAPQPVFGYDFAGWTSRTVGGVQNDALPETGVLDTSGLAPGSKIVYTGTWTAHVGTIRFDGNGATGDEPEDMVVRIAAPEGVLPEPTGLENDGMEFQGWSVSPDGSGTVYPAGTPASTFVGEGRPISENGDEITLYAVWKRVGGLELPKTGGIGTEAYIVIGSTMALLSGLSLLRKRRYR